MANPVGRWKKGESGNPSGRPKSAGIIAELAKERTQDALDCLIKIMTDEEQPAASRVSAATAILDRGWGKPTQSVESKVEHSGSIAHEHSAVSETAAWLASVTGEQASGTPEKPVSH